MQFVINMLIMNHVHPLTTEMKGKKTYKLPKCMPIDTNQINPTYKLMDVKEKW